MLELQKRKGIPKYLQLRDIIHSKIESEEYPVGNLIPSESDLMQKYKLSNATVRQALLELEKEGFLRREQGRGTYVNSKQSIFAKPTITVPRKYKATDYSSSLHKVALGILEECQVMGVDMASPVGPFHAESFKSGNQCIIWPWPGDELLPLIRKLSISNRIVLINQIVDDGSDITYFSTDHYNAALQGMRVLLEHGHQKIGHLSFDIRQRSMAYLDTMRQIGAEPRPEYMCLWSPDKDDSQFDQLLNSGVTAIFVAQGLLLPMLMRSLKTKGFKVPSDIEIIAFNQIPDDAAYKNHVHEIIEPFREAARLAVRYCLNPVAGHGNRLLQAEILVKDLHVQN